MVSLFLSKKKYEFLARNWGKCIFRYCCVQYMTLPCVVSFGDHVIIYNFSWVFLL